MKTPSLCKSAMAVVGLFLPLQGHAQTQVDLRTQTKSADLSQASQTKPMRTAASLPQSCSEAEMLLLTTAPAGSNIYACVSGTWVPQATSGTLTVQNGGQTVGARQTQNFVPGAGVINTVTDTGVKLNIQQAVDTAVVVSQTTLQSGAGTLCRGTADAPPVYSCRMTPSLVSYTTGMTVNWVPSATNVSSGATLDIDILGAVLVIRADGTAVGTGDIAEGRLYTIWYDGTAFRLPPAATGGGGTTSSGPPGVITSTGAGGPTLVTATAEWHAPLAFCGGASGPQLAWSSPPSGTAATAGGCSGSNVAEGYAVFPLAGNPSIHTSLVLPATLTGKADVSLYYVPDSSGSTFSMALDAVCTPATGVASNDPPFTAGNFFAPGMVVSPPNTGSLAVVTASALDWPTGCVSGTRAHLRLRRTDSAGTSANVNTVELVIALRKVL